MAVETHGSVGTTEDARGAKKIARALRRVFEWCEARFPFTTLTRRIVILNLLGLAILVSGILYLNQFRAGLIDAKVQSLLTQGEIIAGAIASSSAIDTDRIAIAPDAALGLEAGQAVAPASDDVASAEFPINPERAAPIMRQLIKPTGSRARLYNRDGALILDSDTLYSRGQILRYDLPPPAAEEPDILTHMWRKLRLWLWRQDLPLYREIGGENGKAYPEVASALTGISVPIVRVNDKGELIVSVAIAIQRMRAVLGVLLLSTRGGDIDSIVAAERWEIARVSLVAFGVSLLLSILLARTIAGPMRKLSAAAERVRRSVRSRTEIPDYTYRNDEIGHLSGALRDMTLSLYRRIDANESFAADVAHELKNPLTSLRSAAETLPLASDRPQQRRLIDVIQHDVRRLDRLITDISDASRLDAELVREDAEPVDIAKLLNVIVPVFTEIPRENCPKIELNIATPPSRKNGYVVYGHDSRLGQVITNLLENAVSFSPHGGRVTVNARRLTGEVEIAVSDEGPGVRSENLEKIFERFYTDRPGEDDFGQNSGLGLNISQQIILAHGGRIWVENRGNGSAATMTGSGRKNGADGGNTDAARDAAPGQTGARFVIRLPAA